jgi:hypothetical protein
MERLKGMWAKIAADDGLGFVLCDELRGLDASAA